MSDALRDAFVRAGDDLLRVVADAARRSGKQGDDLAHDLDIDPGHLSQALNGGPKHFSVKWLPRVIHADRERRILRHLAALVDCDVVERRSLSPTEQLELLKRECRNSGVAGAAILRNALGDE